MQTSVFDELVEIGWLNSVEASKFNSNEELIKVISESTSPKPQNIFNALKSTSLNKVKVLILGQDPYPNPLHAHGLAFSSKNSMTPGSLRNIFKAIDSVYKSNLAETKNNDLTHWADSGVLLLNTSLTYKDVSDIKLSAKENKKNQSKESRQHLKIWSSFIDTIIEKLLNRNQKLVMLLWGGDAYNIVLRNLKRLNIDAVSGTSDEIRLKERNILILYTDHPSQVKINLGGKFLEKAPEHFKKCDEFLNKDKICWTKL